MKERSPFFLIFMVVVLGASGATVFPRKIGFIVIASVSIWFFSKVRVDLVTAFAAILFGLVILTFPSFLPNGRYFLTGKVVSSSKTGVRISNVKFHEGNRWIRGTDSYIFLGGFGKRKEIGIGETFVALVKKENDTCEAEKYFSFSLNSFTEQLHAFGARISNFLYSQFKEYTFGEVETISSLFIGRKTLSYDALSSYKNGGYAHIFSVSGMHVGMIAFFSLLFLAEFIPWNIAKYPLTFLLVALYGFVTGLSIPTFRAVVMFGLFTLFKLIDRPQTLLNVLGMVGTFEVLKDPSLVFDVSFQLSYAAVVAIAMLFPVLPEFHPKWLSDAVRVTIAANVGVAPFLILHFSKIYVVSFIFNSTIVPLLVFILMEGALLFSFFAFVGFTFGEKLIGGGIYVFSKILDQVAYITEKMPLSVLEMEPAKVFFWISLSCVVLLFLWFYFSYPFGSSGRDHRNSADDPRS